MRLTDQEKADLAELGFVVRPEAFDADEIAALQAATEELCRDVEAAAGGAKMRMSEHYVFELDDLHDTVIKWEPGTDDVLQGLEPFAHLHPAFDALASHAALTDPARDVLGLDDVALYTEKLNVKRAHVGGSYALHQDYPYWKGVAEEPEQLVTAWLALDDATATNGALEVLPGSHLGGEVPGKADVELDFERNEIDESTYDTSKMVTVEVPAGGVVFFGPFLVHRSAPNHSDHDRRAVLYTYQREGLRTQRENVRIWAAAERARRVEPA